MPRFPSRCALARLLCALCGIWAVIAPVAPQIHQSFVKHRHVYCDEHNRIEDNNVLETQDRFQNTMRRFETTTVSGVVSSTLESASGSECLFSNFLAHALARTSSRTITGLLSAEISRTLVREIDLRSLDPYRIAPKTSPPTSA